MHTQQKAQLITTEDGSHSLFVPHLDEHYHSTHGAIQESRHVYIHSGFEVCQLQQINVLEIGFGTGLNAFLTLIETQKNNVKVNYTGVEAYPLDISEIETLNYPSLLNASEEDFLKLHNTPWEIEPDGLQKQTVISENFSLTKQKKMFSEITAENSYNLIYFDAFGIRVQPELWTQAIFKIMFNALKPNGILVTYAASGNARRAMQAVGFAIERLPGPPGKREMLRGVKV